MIETWVNAYPVVFVAILGLIVAGVTLFASSLSFFKMPTRIRFSTPSFWMLPLGFLFYFSLPLLAIPLSQIAGSRLQMVLSLMLLSGFLMILFTSLFGKKRLLSIWNPGLLSRGEQARSIAIGSLTYFLALPWVALFSAVLFFALTAYLGEPPPLVDQDAVRFLKSTFEDKLLFMEAVLAIALFVPIAEEILFRGLLQSTLSKYFPISFSIPATSLFFALMHYSDAQGYSNIQIVGSLFVLSIFLGFLYERQKTLFAPIALHITFNLMSVFALSLS